MGSSEFPRKPLKVLLGNLAVDDHPIHEGVVILLATMCYMETGISSGWVGQ